MAICNKPGDEVDAQVKILLKQAGPGWRIEVSLLDDFDCDELMGSLSVLRDYLSGEIYRHGNRTDQWKP